MISFKDFHPKVSHVLVDGSIVGQYYPAKQNMVFTHDVSEATERKIREAIADKFDSEPSLHAAPRIPQHIKESIESGES